MQTIQPLSPDIIAKIAAGEVVQNPASVVKELIENSLDAQATFIEIELQNGGIDSIRIKDNGKGMSKEDLAVCFLPHTTSKISSADDLYSLDSFGFRGEAIWSIASVSTMHIRSRQHGAPHGNEVTIKEDTVIDQKPAGIPEGTDVLMTNLFSNTPARKKFLKDSATETRAVVESILTCSLSFPQVGWVLRNNGKELLVIPQQQSHEDRLRTVLGEYMALHTLPLQQENRYGKLFGYIGKPQLSGRNRAHQYLFVNNRAVSPSLLSKHISRAYGNLIEPRSYPVFVLHIDLPKDHIDVNIHPRKEEVAFIYEQEVANLIHSAISQTLKDHDLTYRDVQGSEEIIDMHNNQFGGMNMALASLIRSSTTPWNVKEIPAQDILQVNNLYLIAPTSTGILLIDQHAAHERILYEQFLSTFKAEQAEMKKVDLAEPCIFDIPTSDAQLLSTEIEKLQHIGFDIEPFGAHTFRISAVPELFKGRNYAQTILEVLHQLKEFGAASYGKIIDKETDRTLSFLACRTAIKGGDPLTLDERKNLVEKLLQITKLNHAYTCPHGRPTHIELSFSELEKMFKRKM